MFMGFHVLRLLRKSWKQTLRVKSKKATITSRARDARIENIYKKSLIRNFSYIVSTKRYKILNTFLTMVWSLKN